MREKTRRVCQVSGGCVRLYLSRLDCALWTTIQHNMSLGFA